MSNRSGIFTFWSLVGWLLIAAPALPGTISPGLERQLATASDHDIVKVLVVLADQVDVPALDRSLRTDKAARNQRHQLVVGELQRLAATSQQDLLLNLGANKALGEIRGYTAHWLVNAVVVTGTVSAVRDLAQRDDVLRIEANLVAELIEPVAAWEAPAKGTAGIGITPGIVAIGARRVWNDFGIDGTGVLVGIIDTGVDINHSAFSSRWQGHFTSPAETWLDAAQLGHPALPYDRDGHGTHVMGIMTGVADGDTIGVAPGAHWIATNGIEIGSATFDNAIVASLEFMTDPDGDPNTLADVPDVVENSWGVNENFAGYIDCDSSWWGFIDNCEAAGVVLVWAAGNEGPIAGTVRSPADRAASPYNCFSVGSTSNHAPFTVSSFSSRGPSGCGGVYAIKPEITAPGDTIYSAKTGGGYLHLSGTSMAGPHVAGTVALMRQANPDLDVTTIKDILMNTAVDQGNAGPDDDYGSGFVDAYAAVQAVMGNIGTVSGRVTNGDTGLPMAGAMVERVGGENMTYTDADGQYSITMYAGATTLTGSSFGYFDNSVSVFIPDGGTVTGDLVLTPQPAAVISGTVRGPDSLPVSGATVLVLNAPVPAVTTNGAGFYTMTLPLGAPEPYSLHASILGLGSQMAEVILTAPVTVDFDLPELTWEDFETGGFQSYDWQAGGSLPWQIESDSTYEGNFSARSGGISNGQSTRLFLEYYVAAASDLGFWYSISSEFGYDILYFLVDEEVQGAWSGEVDWTYFAVNVPKGNHTFRWAYIKDEVVSEGYDTARIDLIKFPATGEELFPDIATSAVSVVQTLGRGAAITRSLVVSNNGGENLHYSVSAVPLNKTVNIQQAGQDSKPRPDQMRRRQLAKGQKDQQITETVVPLGSGGPDGFGYTWQDSDDPLGPAFAWFDISAIGTLSGTGDDMSHGVFELGFPMTYYGQLMHSVRINTNGFLSFTDTSSPYVNLMLPDTISPNNVVAPFWDDLDPSAGGQIYHWADPAADRFIVQYQDVRRYGSSATETFQVILRSSGAVVFQYLAVSETGFCTVGIENATSDDGVTVLYNADDYLYNGLAIRFEPPGFLPWMQVSPLAGIVYPGEEATLTLDFDATEMSLGTHVATLDIASNDPDTPNFLIPLILTIEIVSGVQPPALPQALNLRGAVPNPFNPQTEIHYALPQAGTTSLEIYDVKGRHVRTLVDTVVPAGQHTVLWDGQNGRGHTVASGTYFARLVFGQESQVKAMSLVR